MRITKRQLRRIIKEEKARLISELAGDRAGAFDILDELRDTGVPDEQIVDYIIGNHLPGATAFEVMNDARDEFLGSSPWQESDDDRREREEEEALANL